MKVIEILDLKLGAPFVPVEVFIMYVCLYIALIGVMMFKQY